MRIKKTRRRGFTLIEIMIVVAIISLLAAIAIPNLFHARQKAQVNACISNLRTIDGAKQQWALECGKTSADKPLSTDIQPYIGRGSAGSLERTFCPLVPPAALAGYEINDMSTLPVCKQEDPVTHPAVLN